jgi:hypothetical protein
MHISDSQMHDAEHSMSSCVGILTAETSGADCRHRSSARKRRLEAALGNPNTSDQHRIEVRSQLERLEKLLIGSDLSKIEALTIEVE